MNGNQETSNQYLTFKLSKDNFAIEILKVREVLDYKEPTAVPRSPEFLVGVINLRGNVVPVVDMRIILGMPQIAVSIESCIIIIEISIFDEAILVGALADSVQEVVDIIDSAIDPPPKIGTKLRTDFLRGIGKVGSQFVMILNMDKILSIKELEMVERLNDAGGVSNSSAQEISMFQ
jgi:purine-binding chemotaxis protein CheW